MSDASDFSTQLKDSSLQLVNEIIPQLPAIFGALLLLLVGWLVARLVRAVTIRVLTFSNQFLDRILTTRTRVAVRFSDGVSRLLGAILFWVTLFLFATAAARMAGLDGVASWFERILDYLPSILAGGLIILVGYILSSLVKDVTLEACRSAELAEADLVSRLAQAITFVTALIIGMEQIGVDVTFLITIIGIATAALLTGFAIAFGLGARTFVSNLIAAHYMKELLEPGHKVRIGEIEGIVLEVSPTTLILDTKDGRTSIPANLYQEQAVSIVMDEMTNG